MPLEFPPAIEEFIDRIGGRRRAAIAGVGLLTVVLILGLSRWASAPTYIPVYTDLPLETVEKITRTLEENGIAYRLERGGAELHVTTVDLARTRVLLAGEGLPSAGRPGLELFDQPSWGMTDFAQRVNYRRALEGELERTIGRMRGVESAQVHLAMDETRNFQTDNQGKEASVVLRLRSGTPPGQDVVRGIQHLLASSVDGMLTDNVTVLDEAGRLLSAPSEPGSLEALSSRQLAMQREVEQYLEAKAQQLVDQVVGPANARVKVAAAINFDRVERTTQRLDPDGQVVASETKAQIVPGAEGGAGSNNTNTSYENSRSMESFTGATGNVKRLTVAVVVDQKRVPAAGEAAVYEPRTAAELAQIETLVRSAVGVDAARGDVVSVVSMRFSEPPLPAPPAGPDAWSLLRDYRSELLTLISLLLAAFVALRVVRSLRAPAPSAAEAALLSGGTQPDALPAPDGAASLPQPELVLPRRTLNATNTRTRSEVIATVEEQPDVAARLVRVWLKEA